MQQHQDQKPSQGRHKVRFPLDHPIIDALDLRIRNLLDAGGLTEVEYGRLLKERSRLSKIEPVLVRLTHQLALPEADLSLPQVPYHVFAGAGGVMGEMLQNHVNYIARVCAYVARIENRFFVGGDI